MLAPALDKAIYQAELASCGAQLHGVGGGLITYASNNKRYYPTAPPWTTRAPATITYDA